MKVPGSEGPAHPAGNDGGRPAVKIIAPKNHPCSAKILSINDTGPRALFQADAIYSADVEIGKIQGPEGPGISK